MSFILIHKYFLADRFELSKDLVDVFKASLKDTELEEVLNKIQNSSDVTL